MKYAIIIFLFIATSGFSQDSFDVVIVKDIFRNNQLFQKDTIHGNLFVQQNDSSKTIIINFEDKYKNMNQKIRIGVINPRNDYLILNNKIILPLYMQGNKAKEVFEIIFAMNKCRKIKTDYRTLTYYNHMVGYNSCNKVVLFGKHNKGYNRGCYTAIIDRTACVIDRIIIDVNQTYDTSAYATNVLSNWTITKR